MKYASMAVIGMLLAGTAQAGPKQDKDLTEALGVPVYIISCKAGAGCLKDAIAACGAIPRDIRETPKRRAITYGTLRVSNDTEAVVICEKAAE